jgi:hypothetical protein
VPDNVLNVGGELFSVIAGTITLLGAALAFSFKYHAVSERAASRGHRPDEQANEGEVFSPDGFIDSFAGRISEAGGGMPWLATAIMLVVLACYFIYLIVNWKG